MIVPSEKQMEFLSSEADIGLYGGGAGGGKSFGLLMTPLYHIDVPKFNAVFFRRSIVELRNAGGLWQESKNLYFDVNGTPREVYMDWNFKSGANIKFAHLENDNAVYNWQGSQIALLGFDEVTHFSEHQFFYLLSRNRSTCGIKPYIRATCNPDKDSWVRRFIDWWIDPDTGYAIPERSGVLRWFIRKDGKLLWGNTKEELLPFGNPKSVTFIPALLQDNKILMENDPNYLSNLEAQNKVERAKLLEGNWNISYTDYGVVLNRSMFSRFNLQEKLQIPGFFKESYFVFDGASTVKTSSDYSVLMFFAKAVNDNFIYLIDVVRVKMLEPDVEQLAVDTWNYWKSLKIGQNCVFTPKGINLETGSTGFSLITRLSRKGIPTFELKPVKDKFQRLNDGLGLIKNQFVLVPENANWANKFFEECECFRADLKHVLMENETAPHDDQVDCLAYGIGSEINQIGGIEVYKKLEPFKRKHGSWLYN